ncbi:hypothetical protein C7212DRAFT_285054 [Tuber magnatum]|uniref:C2H2-type domain-containing protein n=1 Tax=Tuber magnatum TaxID=42249 RepID=A0A317SIW8_9PEZI|nr:hypothetical protein C7212DRAFT_285054 [Tuber magnatum]
MEPVTQSSYEASPPPKPRPRRFPCTYEGCGKAFTRSEHLQRHELNHRPSPNTCMRCRAHFARPDLLDRHMERHVQKDKLAGGEGLGVLGTRKRCWRDDNGNITTKRPAASLASLPKLSTSPRSQKGKGREEGSSGGGETGNMCLRDACAATTESIAPSCSTASSARRQRNDGGHAHNISPVTATATEAGAFDQFHSQRLGMTEPGMFENENFQLPPPPPPQTYQFDPLLSNVPPSEAETLIANYQAEFDQTFSVDPASSFTMPFTTLVDYTWLFCGSASHPGAGGQCGTGFALSQAQSDMELDLESPFAAGPGDGDQLMATPMDHSPFPSFGVKDSANAFGTVSQQYPDFQGLGGLNKTPPVEDHSLYFLSHAQSIPHDTPSRDLRTAPTANITQHSLGSEPARTLSTPHTQYSIPITNSPTSSRNRFHMYASASAPTSETPSPTLSYQPLPKIDEAARTKVLSLIIQATTNDNGEPQFGWDDPLLSLSALQSYLDLFFSRFNQSYPLLHRPSFDPSNVNPLLLVSVLMLGATYGEKEAHQMALRVHDVLRGVLVSVGLMSPEVWRRKSGTNMYEFGRERIYSLIAFMLRSIYGLCKRCC